MHCKYLLSILSIISALHTPSVFAVTDPTFGFEFEFPTSEMVPTLPVDLNAFVKPSQGGHIHINFSEVLTKTWNDSRLMKQFGAKTSTNRNAQLFVIADPLSPTWEFAEIVQKKAIERLSSQYQTVQNIALDTNSLAQIEGLLKKTPVNRYQKLFQPAPFDKAIYQARTSTYLEEDKVDYYFIIVGEKLGPMNAKTFADIEYIDKKAKGLVVIGSSESTAKGDLFTNLSTHENTFNHLAIFDFHNSTCAYELLETH